MNELWWYQARAAGLVSYVLLTASVVLGLAYTTRVLARRARPAWLLDVHRGLGALATIFVGIHVLAILFDTYMHFSVVDVLVPFASSWNPSAMAWGIVGFWVLLAVELTSLARARLPRRLWRVTHVASFPLFFAATLHTLFAGTDAGNPVVRWGLLASVAAVLALTLLRLWQLDERETAQARRPAALRR